MKKLILALALAGLSSHAVAQDEVPVQKYSVATRSFWSNWFVQVGGDWNVWYSGQEHHADNHNGMGFFGSERRTFGGSVALGKWFTPGLGLRTKWQIGRGKAIPALEPAPVKYDMWLLNEHLMLNLSNLFCGYSDTRVWNVIPFVGGGVSRNMSRDVYAAQLSVGIQSAWRLTPGLQVYLEAGWNSVGDGFDGTRSDRYPGVKNHRGWDARDNHVYGEVGLTLSLGKSGWEKMPDLEAMRSMSQSQLDALNAQLEDANAENARLQKLLDEGSHAEVAQPLKRVGITKVSVFFNLNRSEIASRKDLVNVEALARYAKDAACPVIVTGYADSDTGSAEVNRQLSEARAAVVAEELVKMGVDRSKITTVGKGGVKDLSPVSYNRRVTVEIAE